MKTIQLTQGQVAIVCDCHAHLVDNQKWLAMWDDHKKQFSARRRATILELARGSAKWIRMHTIINGTPKGLQTDHIDNDSLNNQCTNLRTASNTENMRNRGRPKNNTSGYKGVIISGSQSKPWHAQITADNHIYHLGNYRTPEEAARAYDAKARELHGRFANLNFPE